jgi:hypothetical protein
LSPNAICDVTCKCADEKYLKGTEGCVSSKHLFLAQKVKDQGLLDLLFKLLLFRTKNVQLTLHH